MNGAALVKRWRDVHPMGQVLTVCAVFIGFLLCLVLSFAAYMVNEPNQDEAKRALLSIRQGLIKPNASGLVETADHTVYVTYAAGGCLVVLWPYNLAHDDNYFEGLLFSDQVLKNRQITALGPTRARYPGAPYSFMTNLRVDHEISEHWYHVQGKMYK